MDVLEGVAIKKGVCLWRMDGCIGSNGKSYVLRCTGLGSCVRNSGGASKRTSALLGGRHLRLNANKMRGQSYRQQSLPHVDDIYLANTIG